MELAYKRIGITGAKGFVGNNLINHLSKKNIHVTPFVGDLLDASTVRAYFKNYHIDQIIHLVGSFDPPFDYLFNKNVLPLQHLLEIGKHNGLKKVVYASSGAVYGQGHQKEFFETDRLNPNTLYGLSKQFAEEVIFYYQKNSDLTGLILRFPNIYSSNPKEGKGAINTFLKNISENKKITITGNGTETRNFLHVNDVCQALEKSLYYNNSDIFNISNPANISLNEVVKKLKEKYEFSVDYVPSTNNLLSLSLNIDKAKEILHFNPTIIDLDIC